MPFNPNVADISGQLLASGVSQFAKGISDGMEKHQLTAADVANLTGKANGYAQTGVLTSDDLEQFASGNISKKREIVSKADTVNALMVQELTNTMKQYQLDMERQRLEQQGQWHNDEVALKREEMNASNFTPTPEQLNQLNGTGYTWAQQSKHGGTWLPTKQAGGAAVEPSETTLPSGDKVVDLGNGKRTVVRQGNSKPLNSGDAMMLGTWKTQLANVDQELNDHTTAMSQGDNRYGFLNTSIRENRVKELQGQRSGLQAKIDALQQGRSGSEDNSGAAASTNTTTQTSPQPQTTQAAQPTYKQGGRYKLPDGSVKTFSGGDPANSNNWK
ncbi:MAG: hypothetical protein ACFUZC_05035 [Chthoniobacteraceae bacterium]